MPLALCTPVVGISASANSDVPSASDVLGALDVPGASDVPGTSDALGALVTLSLRCPRRLR